MDGLGLANVDIDMERSSLLIDATDDPASTPGGEASSRSDTPISGPSKSPPDHEEPSPKTTEPPPPAKNPSPGLGTSAIDIERALEPTPQMVESYDPGPQVILWSPSVISRTMSPQAQMLANAKKMNEACIRLANAVCVVTKSISEGLDAQQSYLRMPMQRMGIDALDNPNQWTIPEPIGAAVRLQMQQAAGSLFQVDFDLNRCIERLERDMRDRRLGPEQTTGSLRFTKEKPDDGGT